MNLDRLKDNILAFFETSRDMLEILRRMERDLKQLLDNSGRNPKFATGND